MTATRTDAKPTLTSTRSSYDTNLANERGITIGMHRTGHHRRHLGNTEKMKPPRRKATSQVLLLIVIAAPVPDRLPIQPMLRGQRLPSKPTLPVWRTSSTKIQGRGRVMLSSGYLLIVTLVARGTWKLCNAVAFATIPLLRPLSARHHLTEPTPRNVLKTASSHSHSKSLPTEFPPNSVLRIQRHARKPIIATRRATDRKIQD